MLHRYTDDDSSTMFVGGDEDDSGELLGLCFVGEEALE
jgi:hypothetical protein